MRLINFYSGILGLIVMGSVHAASDLAIELSAVSFNPTLQNTLGATFILPADDNVTLRVYDPDKALIRTLADKQAMKAGKQEVIWDGRDDGGELVPDEAYTFVVETTSGLIVDPWTVSGGVVEDITVGQFDKSAGTLRYQLPKPARVLIRLGLKNGPMLKTLVDWRPRSSGLVTEYWDGFDEDNLIRFRDTPGFTSLITYSTLPDATVIAFGNKAESYRAYKLGRGKDQSLKADRPWKGGEDEFRPLDFVPSAWARSPKVILNFSGIETGKQEQISGDKVLLSVDVSKEDLPFVTRNQFEIIFYMDGIFFAEAERGYLPFNWLLELQEFSAGEHILSVNISSATGQIGVASQRVVKAGKGDGK